LHQDEPLLIPGLSDFANYTGAIDLGTLDERAYVKRVKGENIIQYKARKKRESRHRNRKRLS
jgi:hypothetical protein